MKNIKVVFMGTPDFSVPVLEGLIENYQVVGVVTQPDRKVGRKQEICFSPIKKLALEHNILVFQPEKIRVDFDDILKQYNLKISKVICGDSPIIIFRRTDLTDLGKRNYDRELGLSVLVRIRLDKLSLP